MAFTRRGTRNFTRNTCILGSRIDVRSRESVHPALRGETNAVAVTRTPEHAGNKCHVWFLPRLFPHPLNYTILSYMMVYCIVLYCIILYYIVLYYIVLYYILLYYILLYYIVLYCIVLYRVLLYRNVLYCFVFYSIVLYSMIFYCIVLYCIILLLYPLYSLCKTIIF